MLCPVHTPQFPPEIFIMKTNYEASKYRNFSSFMSFPIFALNTLFNTLFLKTLNLCFLFYVTDQFQTHMTQENTTALYILNYVIYMVDRNTQNFEATCIQNFTNLIGY
jgi:hypothetical protein